MDNIDDPKLRTHLDDPRVRREFERDADDEGMTTAAWAGIAFVFLLFGGVMVYAFTGDRATTASNDRPGIERSVPPATTGQGGAQSKMPTAKEKAE